MNDGYILAKAHTAEHLLAGSLKKINPSYEIIKIELSPSYSKLFVKGAPSFVELEKCQKLANEKIKEGLDVIESFQKKMEVKDARIRADRIKGDNARIISIGDFDRAACSGEHAKNTKEIGLVLITGFKKESQNVSQIIFAIGEIACKHAIKSSTILNELCYDLNENIENINKRISKDIAELGNSKNIHRKLSEEFFAKIIPKKFGKIFFINGGSADSKKAMQRMGDFKNDECAIILLNDSIIVGGKKSDQAFSAISSKFNIIGGGKDVKIGKICPSDFLIIEEFIKKLEL
jgi:alanyl-tRNA synthetase